MTYEKKYEISNIIGRKNKRGLTLYEAQSALAAAAAQGRVKDSTAIIRRSAGKPVFVGFWSVWHGAVKPGFQSSEQERALLTTWSA